jgi:DNA-directed RNA polymerase specialized sigma subunit
LESRDKISISIKFSFQELKNYESSIRDLNVASELEPDNKAVANHLNLAKAKHKEASLKISRGMKKMFS